MLEARVAWIEEMEFQGESGSGHAVIMDAADEFGGRNRGARPMELVLVGLGGCTGMDVISILKKMRQEVTGYEIEVKGERASEHPKVFTDITIEHIVRGRNLSEESVRKAVDLSHNKYCSAIATMNKVANITSTVRIVEVPE